jgi:hypothetical protein
MYKPYFLQSITEFEIHTSKLDVFGFIIVFAILAALIIFMNTSNRIKNNAIFKGKGVDIKLANRSNVDKIFFSQVKYLGLNKKEASVLEKILKVNGENPSAILGNSAKVDECFKYTYNRIMREKKTEDSRQELLELFSIRNAVEYFYAVRKNGSKKVIVRSFRRKSSKIPCTIYPIVVKPESNKFNAPKKLVIENKDMYQGIVMNVSQGGCAITTMNTFKTGSFIKIGFNIGREPVTALGQILRFNKDNSDWVYHIKFLKLSKNSILALNVFVFDYL